MKIKTSELQDTDAGMLVSLDGGSTYSPALDGVRIIYKDIPIDGEDGLGEVHINATHEGLITDIWTTRDEPLDHNIGTKIPVIIGKNRLRGNATGAMVEDDYGEDNLGTLRNILRDEARNAGVEATREWLNTSVGQLLSMYEKSHVNWQQEKNGCIGHVFEAALPSGQVVIMGERRVLARLN